MLSSSLKGWQKGWLGNVADVGKNFKTASVNVSGDGEKGALKLKRMKDQAATSVSELLETY